MSLAPITALIGGILSLTLCYTVAAQEVINQDGPSTALDTTPETTPETTPIPPPITVPVTHNVCPTNLQRPCVGLVLGGGGARGSAHIGVLKALEERGIPVDLVVGTSIGSFVGGLYASGKSAAEIQALFEAADWNAGYRDDLSRSQIPNRRKRQLDAFPIHLDLGFDGSGIKLPKGFLQGQGMKALVDSMLGYYPEFASFDNLPLPFRAVAADAESGEEVILDHGDLATALQISMSIPGVVRPVERDGRILVDGGVANNLPVSVAKAMGAEVVIAVDIGAPSMEKADLSSGVSILRQLTNFLTEKNLVYQKSLLSERDIFLHPDTGDIGMLNFERTPDAIKAGYAEGERVFDQHNTALALRELRSTAPANPQSEENEKPSDETQTVDITQADTRLRVDAILIENRTRLSDNFILQRMQLEAGNTYSVDEIQAGIDRLYGQGTIARITTSVSRVGNENQLNISVEEKEWGPGYLDFKLTFEDNFSSLSRYQIGAAYRLTNLSPHGAEWYTATEFGTDKYFYSELYWPINSSGFFWDLAGGFERRILEYVEDGDLRGELTESQLQVVGGVGWSSTDVFDVALGATYLDSRIELPNFLAEQFNINEVEYAQTGAVLDINYDSLDHASFPSRGWKLNARVTRTRDDILGEQDYTTQVDAEFNGVVSLGAHSLRSLIRAQSTINNDPLSVLGSFSLGGFLNLSGNAKNTIIGPHVRLFSLVYTYQLAANDFGAITLPLYLGVSAETGNAWETRETIDYNDMISSGSVFVGWDSPIGPAYLAYGHSDTDEKSLYMFLGVVF